MGWLSALISGASTLSNTALNYQYSKDLQDRQNRFTERMSNTAHQREVKDLREAGLNPILSATGGTGASTPSAGSATFTGDNPVTSALDALRYKQELKINNSQIDLNKQQANKALYEADVAHANSAYATEQTRQLMEYGPQKARAEINLINAQANATRNTARATKIDTDFSEKHPILYGLSRIGGPVAGVTGVGVGAYSAYQNSQIQKQKLKSKK